MVLYENTASVIAAVSSGLSIESGGVAQNKYEDRMTPVEPRISGEVAHAVAGMKRKDANDILGRLLPKYESRMSAPPLGKSLRECWDADRRRPTREYRTKIKAYKKTMIDLGVDLKPEE